MSLRLTAKKLYLLDFCELVGLANGNSKTASQYEVETARSVFASETVSTSDHKTSSQYQLKPSSEAQNASDAHSPCTAFEPARHGQPVRALSGCDNREDQGQLPEDVLRSVGQPAHCLRRGETGAEIQGCSRGSKVHSLVCQEVREFPKVCSSDVHPLHSDLHGATRDDTGIRPSAKTIDTGTQSQVQGSTARSPRRRKPPQLDGRGSGTQAVERAPRKDVSHDEGGNDPTEWTHRECRECLAADFTSASSPDPSDDGARRSTETMSECGHGHDLRSWICDAAGNHMISQQKQDALDVNPGRHPKTLAHSQVSHA